MPAAYSCTLSHSLAKPFGPSEVLEEFTSLNKSRARVTVLFTDSMSVAQGSCATTSPAEEPFAAFSLVVKRSAAVLNDCRAVLLFFLASSSADSQLQFAASCLAVRSRTVRSLDDHPSSQG